MKMQDNFEEHIKEKLLGNSLTPSDNVWNNLEQKLGKKEGFENKFKDKTDDLVLGNLNPNIWKQIEAQLNKKRRRRALLWFVLAIGTASASIFALSKFETAENEIVVEQKTKPSPTIELDSKRSSQYTTSNSANKNQEKFTASKIQISTEEKQQATFKFVKQSNGNKQIKTAKAGEESTILAQFESPILTTAEIKKAENTLQKNTSSIEPSHEAPMESKSIELVKEITSPETKTNILKTDSVAESLNFKANTYRKQNEKNYGNWALILGSGINFTGMQLLSNNQPNLSNRQAIESPSLDWNSNLLVHYQATKNWSISSGLSITHFKQNLNFNKTPAKGSIVHPLNANSYIYATDSIGTGNQNALENRYTFLELPFNLNYQFKQSNKWSWQLQLGYSLGLLYHVDAYHLDPNNIGFVIVNSTDNFPQFNAAHFVSIAPKMEYQLSKGYNLGLQMNCKTSVNSIIQTQNWIQQKPYLLGFEISLKKRF